MPQRDPHFIKLSGSVATFKPVLCVVVSTVLLTFAPGCRICGSCEDIDYPAYGGAWQRTDRTNGRVGSVFDPGGVKGSILTERDEPTEIDEVERDRKRGSAFGDDENEDPDDSNSTPPDPRQEDSELPSLEDIEDERSNELRDLQLDDIEVKLVRPGRRPRV